MPLSYWAKKRNLIFEILTLDLDYSFDALKDMSIEDLEQCKTKVLASANKNMSELSLDFQKQFEQVKNHLPRRTANEVGQCLS